jgi:hypothetical protein
LSDEYDGSLSGNITDKEMNPISGVKVTIKCGDYFYECYSNDAGYYHQDNIPIVDCYWNVTASKLGYNDANIQIPIDINSKHNFTLISLNIVEIEEIKIQNKINIKYYRDKNIGQGVVRGHFFIINNAKKALIAMVFFKYVPPGYVAFDLVCTNISINVKNPLDEITHKYRFSGDDILFSNNWIGSTTLLLPDYYDYSILEIIIYGNYE